MSDQAPNLPPELLSRILDQCSIPTLRTVTLCSRQLYDIATPYLYKTVNDSDTEREEDDSRLLALTIHFLRNPKLAAHVRHFSFRPPCGSSRGRNTKNRDHASLSATLEKYKDLDESIKGAIQAASHSEEEQIIWLEEAVSQDSLLGLIISAFKRLETLDLEMPGHSVYVERLFGRVARSEKPYDVDPTLQNLKSITWFHDDEKYGDPFASAPFLLPSVQEVFFHRVASSDNDDELDENLQSVEDGSSACTHLELKDCRNHDKDVRKLLSIPKALKTFIYEIGWGHISYCIVSFPSYREGLENHKNSLENLWLGYGHDGMEWLTEEVMVMPGFKDFPQLRRMRIAPDFIFGQTEICAKEPDRYKKLLEFLPQNIETLHLTHVDDWGEGSNSSSPPDRNEVVYNAIENVLSHKETDAPLLESVILETTLERTEEDKARLLELKGFAQSKEVELILRNRHGGQTHEACDDRKERKWGMEENIEWQMCSSATNQAPIYEEIIL